MQHSTNPNRRRVLLAGASLVPALAVSGLPRIAGAQSQALLTKKIPSSGETIPIIGLGTARRYDSAGTPEEQKRLLETLRRFGALDATVIDTAPVYGNAEQVVGELVAELKLRDKLFLATKVSTGGGRQAGSAQIEGSFKRLRTSKIDLIAVHNLRGTDIHLPTLRELKAAGRICYVGITTSFDGQYADFEAAMQRERLDFIQVDYALDNRDAGARILPLAADRGMAVMVNLPFGRGRLFRAVQGKALPPWAADFDVTTWPQFFLKYIVSHPAVTCAIPGMARPEYVEDNLGAARGRLPDAAQRQRMETFIDAL
ncbi:MAG TPA: aldo/keto reductase [Burkholderiales bacterium]|nr:aldo/keto reductase [Burkholderiales bacterium]